MKLESSCTVPVGLAETWDFLMDIATAAKCVPGVVDVAPDGDGCYRGTLRARVGPMGMTLSGTVTVQEQEPDSARAPLPGGGPATGASAEASRPICWCS